MEKPELNIVTGAFSYTGKYITRRLLDMGITVKTLTGHPANGDPFGNRVKAMAYDFDNPRKLAENLHGATTVYNSYWVRFAHGKTTYEQAVNNTITLIQAAREAGVRRFVHISISNPSENSSLPYFKGKALLEKAVINSGMSYAIIRPTVIFGDEGILVNNIAWLLRNFPIFFIPGRGDYRLQ
ncbi:MAG: SDR family oxidoreductase, partial [Bacillota bacterium]